MTWLVTANSGVVGLQLRYKVIGVNLHKQIAWYLDAGCKQILRFMICKRGMPPHLAEKVNARVLKLCGFESRE